MPETTIDAIDACLPQTQCTRCGYPRCRDYAAALARGETGLNRCPPGGDATIALLAQLLNRAPLPLDPDCGVHAPRTRAVIDEPVCIGCRKCIDVCPVDAIVGARKLMHTVIESECNGCALCLPACPCSESVRTASSRSCASMTWMSATRSCSGWAWCRFKRLRLEA